MPLGDTIDNPISAEYTIAFNYVGGTETHYSTLFLGIRTRVGDLEPVAAQVEAVQALIDLINESDDFELDGIPNRIWTMSQAITPTNPQPSE
jgi:hypothetical protein